MSSQNLTEVLIENVNLCEISDNVLRFDFYSQSHIDELKKSINEKGLLEALLVHKNKSTGKLTMLNGHYRIRALKRLGMKKASCRLVISEEKEIITHYLTSFIQKSSVTAIEEGHIIQELISRGYQLEKIGKLWGKSASWACRRVKLINSLEEEVKKEIKKGSLAPRIAQELTRLPRGKEQNRVFDIVIKNKLTKDETSKLIDKWQFADEKEKAHIENNYSKQIPVFQRNKLVVLPENMLKSYVLHCCRSVANLINCMEYVKDYKKLWPWNEYENFCRQFKQIAALMGSREGEIK